MEEKAKLISGTTGKKVSSRIILGDSVARCCGESDLPISRDLKLKVAFCEGASAKLARG